MRVLMITCEWPSHEKPHLVPFIVRQVEFLRRAGVAIDVFAFRGARNPFNYLRAWYRIHKKLRRERYDLVHAQWGQSAAVALPTRLPLVVTFRGGEGEGIVGDRGQYTMSGRALRFVSRFVAERADELVLVSAHMREYVPARPVHIVPSGLDFAELVLLSREEARQRLGLPADRRFVLFVGDPAEARKRFPLARDVVARLNPDLRAEILVAWGVMHDQIPLYMNAADALLFVSMYEGSPNVIKEALGCNLPVVSVDVGDVALRLAAVPGCVVVPDADPDRLVSALEGVLRHGGRVNGRSAVLDLDERLLARRMVDIYRGALGNRTRELASRQTPEAAGGAQAGARP
jgi:glycosyltransferase involved in cell wall biosynthesis